MEIALKNFRKFKDFPGKDFGSDRMKLNDITLLVGKNNAGKSTLVKALILIIENLRRESNQPFSADAYFDFRSKEHNLHIDTFSRALCNEADDKFIRFEVKIENFLFVIEVEEANDMVLYNHLQDEEDPTAPVRFLSITDLKRNIIYETKPYLQNIRISFGAKENEGELFSKQENFKMIRMQQNHVKRDMDSLQTMLNELLENKSDVPAPLEQIVELQSRINLLSNKIKELNSRLKRLDTDSKKGPQFFNIHTTLHLEQDRPTELSIVQDLLALCDVQIGEKIFLSEEDKRQEKETVIAISNYKQELRSMAKELSIVLRSISFDYVNAHLASQESLLDSYDKDNMLAKIIDEFETHTKKQQGYISIKNFILEWLGREPVNKPSDYKDNNFEIGKDFKIEHIEGHYYVLKIQTLNDKWVRAADLGMGTNQLLILLFQAANNMSSKKKPLIIIEEPEQNLHPQLQTRLANFMKRLHDDNKAEFNFLVETHSEYLVRQTQVHVAKAGYKNEEFMKADNPFAVYYFDEEKIVMPMRYNPNGIFKDKFGNGFFDEASSLAFEVIKLGQKK